MTEDNVYFSKVISKPKRKWYSFILDWFTRDTFYEELAKTSPSYHMMREMASFIKLSEIVFFYANDETKDIYTYTDKDFINIVYTLSKEDNIYCKIGLKQKNTMIDVCVYKKVKDNPDKIITKSRFNDRQLELEEDIDIQLFINIIRILMDRFINLMKLCEERMRY